jgi:hypothetical protein
MHGHIKAESPQWRANVGAEVIMEVTVSNIHTAKLSKAVLSIFYPASSTETGDYFYILPHCELTTAITGGGSIICQDSQLQDISTLSCSNSRRKRIVQLLLSTA